MRHRLLLVFFGLLIASPALAAPGSPPHACELKKASMGYTCVKTSAECERARGKLIRNDKRCASNPGKAEVTTLRTAEGKGVLVASLRLDKMTGSVYGTPVCGEGAGQKRCQSICLRPHPNTHFTGVEFIARDENGRKCSDTKGYRGTNNVPKADWSHRAKNAGRVCGLAENWSDSESRCFQIRAFFEEETPAKKKEQSRPKKK